jgi:type I restriction enzyme, S subunit
VTSRRVIEWPFSWRAVPLWSMFERVKDVGHPDEEMLSVYRDYGVVKKDSRDDNANKTAENRDIYQLVDDGWLIINRMKAWQGSVGISPYRGIVSGHYICFRPRHDENPRFLNWLLRSAAYTIEYLRLSRGVRPNQVEIDNDGLRVLPLHLPILPEQGAIVAFLDRETANIDLMIAKQEDLTAALLEHRAALIEAAVLGESTVLPRPAIGHRFEVTLGKMLDAGKPRRPDDKDLPYLRAANIQDDGLDLETVNSMPFSVSEERFFNLCAGDLLVVEGGAVGTNLMLTADMPGWAFQKTLNRVRPRRDDSSKFLGYALRAMRDNGQIDNLCNKSTIPHLTAEKLASIRLPLPAPTQQRAIVDHLDRETVKIDRLIDNTRALIGVMKERRAVLVSAAVTGQVDRAIYGRED